MCVGRRKRNKSWEGGGGAARQRHAFSRHSANTTCDDDISFLRVFANGKEIKVGGGSVGLGMEQEIECLATPLSLEENRTVAVYRAFLCPISPIPIWIAKEYHHISAIPSLPPPFGEGGRCGGPNNVQFSTLFHLPFIQIPGKRISSRNRLQFYLARPVLLGLTVIALSRGGGCPENGERGGGGGPLEGKGGYCTAVVTQDTFSAELLDVLSSAPQPYKRRFPPAGRKAYLAPLLPLLPPPISCFMGATPRGGGKGGGWHRRRIRRASSLCSKTLSQKQTNVRISRMQKN